MTDKERCLAYLNANINKESLPEGLGILFNKILLKALFNENGMVKINLGLKTREDMEELIRPLYPHWFGLYLLYDGIHCFRVTLFSHLQIETVGCKFCKKKVNKNGSIEKVSK